jgi:hypothetical protein
MRNYIVANQYKLHHTFWCVNIDSADTGGLLTRGEGTAFPGGRDLKWNDNKYDNYLLPTLWRNSEGKFIGLDHKIPLGKNGVALVGSSGPINFGDLNDDIQINSTDSSLMKRYLLGTGQVIYTRAADLNLDESINSTDYTILKRYLLGQIKVLPFTN